MSHHYTKNGTFAQDQDMQAAPDTGRMGPSPGTARQLRGKAAGAAAEVKFDHRAGSQQKEIFRMGETVYTQYENLRAGRPVQYEVTEAMLRTMA